jgi:hypothetical protein
MYFFKKSNFSVSIYFGNYDWRENIGSTEEESFSLWNYQTW